MKLIPLSILVIALTSAGAQAQTTSGIVVPLVEAQSSPVRNDRIRTSGAIAALRRLRDDVISYRSLGEFEATGKLSRVSLDVFQSDLKSATREVNAALVLLPPDKFSADLTNALACYRDGGFWWEKISQPKVVHISALTYQESDHTPAETALLATVPYTVAIYWRQAAKYLKHAETINDRR